MLDAMGNDVLSWKTEEIGKIKDRLKKKGINISSQPEGFIITHRKRLYLDFLYISSLDIVAKSSDTIDLKFRLKVNPFIYLLLFMLIVMCVGAMTSFVDFWFKIFFLVVAGLMCFNYRCLAMPYHKKQIFSILDSSGKPIPKVSPETLKTDLEAQQRRS